VADAHGRGTEGVGGGSSSIVPAQATPPGAAHRTQPGVPPSPAAACAACDSSSNVTRTEGSSDSAVSRESQGIRIARAPWRDRAADAARYRQPSSCSPLITLKASCFSPWLESHCEKLA
jgi:hypothetical protein